MKKDWYKSEGRIKCNMKSCRWRMFWTSNPEDGECSKDRISLSNIDDSPVCISYQDKHDDDFES